MAVVLRLFSHTNSLTKLKKKNDYFTDVEHMKRVNREGIIEPPQTTEQVLPNSKIFIAARLHD